MSCNMRSVHKKVSIDGADLFLLVLQGSHESQGVWVQLKAHSNAILTVGGYNRENWRDKFQMILKGESNSAM